LKKLNHKALLEQFEDAVEDAPKEAEPWIPSLSPTQRKIFDDGSKYILAYGERGSGKTYSLGGHKLVRHCYENFNALALIIVGVRSQATMGGVWHKLQVEILPEWAEGIDLEHTEERQDTQKNLYIDIKNRFGGYSRVVLISVPYGSIIRDRIKGFEPSLIFVDELTNLDTDDYFNAVVQQLGRRQGIHGPQQYLAACNPDGPSHWVYKRFFEDPYDEENNWNEDYAVYHVKIEENLANLPEGYYDRIQEAVKTDPVEEARMVRGEWIDRDSASAIFAPYFSDVLHLKGDSDNGIIPSTKYPIICGWDPGSVNTAVVFMQNLPNAPGSPWIVFDEFVTTEKAKQKLPYTTIIPLIMRKMSYWNRKLDHDFKFIHISDNSAFNQYRAKQGSYDVQDIQDISQKKSETFGLEPIRMKPCPKFNGSVETRVRITIAKLQSDELFVSAKCREVKKMFKGLESQKQGKTYDPNLAFKPKRSVHLHAFDAMSYVLLYYDSVPVQNVSNSYIINIGT